MLDEQRIESNQKIKLPLGKDQNVSFDGVGKLLDNYVIIS